MKMTAKQTKDSTTFTTTRKDWFKRVSKTFNAFANEPFGSYLQTCINPLISSGKITPPKSQIYRALELVPFEKVKVVILGQDPIPHVEGDLYSATGLAFALNPKVLAKNPTANLGLKARSLTKILKNLRSELKITSKSTPEVSLESWAKQGILLLNTALTTRPGKPEAHLEDWKQFLAALILALNSHKRSLIFVLTCKPAKEFFPLISSHHRVFFNYKHPSRCWEIYDTPTCSGKPLNFFKLTTREKINWASVLN
jgi:uracil-DNA glycosylase